MNKRLLSLLLAALLLLALLPAAAADAALTGEQEVLELFAEKKAAKAAEFEFTCEKALFQSLLADNGARLSLLEIKGGIAEARIRFSEQSCLIRLSQVKYSDDPWVECSAEEQAGSALRELLRSGSESFSLLCSPELARSLAGSAILRSYAAMAGFEDLMITYYASGVIQVRDPAPFASAWAPAGDTAQFDAAVETFSLQEADEFTIAFSPAFYEKLAADEEQYRMLHASSILDRYSYSPGEIYGVVNYSRVSYLPEPSLVCRSEEELREAISHLGALEVSNFRLYLADEDLRAELFDTPLAYLHHMEAEAGMTYEVEISHSDNFIHYTNAHFRASTPPLSTAEEAQDDLLEQARAGAGQISLYCTPELYTELAGEEGAFPGDPDCLTPIYDLIARAGILEYDLSLNRPSGAIRVQVFAYAEGLALLRAAETGAEAELTPARRDCLAAARALARDCRGNEPAETAALVREALSGVAILPEGGEDPEADTAVAALLRGEASLRGLLDAIYLVGSLAGLELSYPVLALSEAGDRLPYGFWLRVDGLWTCMLLDPDQAPSTGN